METLRTKTPKFDAALDAILKPLVPHERACKECGATFSIFKEDIEMYKMLIVPPPTQCPDCRSRRRWGQRISSLPVFYKSQCQAPGHTEKIITFYAPQNNIKVFDDEYYLSDNWDQFAYGREYSLDNSFFEQFKALAIDVPHQTLFKDPKSMNCDYVVSGVSAKNCYYVAVPYYSEDVQYSYIPKYTKNSIDVSEVKNVEFCYECVATDDSYNCDFCYESISCMDSRFLYDCKNCTHCFGCTNLRNKKYCFWNEQLTKEEYELRVKEINFGSRKVLHENLKRFEELMIVAIHRHVNNLKVDRVYGDNLRECKNCFYVFSLLGGNENLRYVNNGEKLRDLMDVSGSIRSQYVYESTGVTDGSGIRFCMMIRTGLEMEYSTECNNCEYCFGCVGLRNKKFCIFNKQYDEEGYWLRVDELKMKMLGRSEYGEFFPLKNSLAPYNDSNAMIEHPLTREEVLARGWKWQDSVPSDLDISKMDTLQSAQIPDDIATVTDDILNKVFICEKTSKPFKLTKFELDFYRAKHIPLPTIHPFYRIKDRFRYIHRFKLRDVNCSHCGAKTYTAYTKEQNYKIYCETCYQNEVI